MRRISGATAGDVIALFFFLAVVMVLVRPNSLAPAFIKAFGTGMDALVKFAVTG